MTASKSLTQPTATPTAETLSGSVERVTTGSTTKIMDCNLSLTN